ncbi:hypothetical protein LOTGIDRAFT_160705 [Lottia gigantea]|uniref:Uncharacterized protein n=1 Tax=Lottia gigantea TaxID=225164 RepID=V4ADM7_LOTGI|nr:hypothetical protein LOTGIDRAFT_160705 [Lottia gigantea]ESO94952.1 hypothetical protein LOTGIDRAFT_160705 [Lottia gigantea]
MATCLINDDTNLATPNQDNRPKRKKLNTPNSKSDSESDSNDPQLCVMCEVNFDGSDCKCIICDMCDLSFCLPCSKIQRELYDCIMNDSTNSVKVCSKNFPRFCEMSSNLRKIENDNKEKLRFIEEKIDRVEQSVPQLISSEVKKLREKVTSDLNQDIDSRVTILVQQQMEEKDEQRRRENNMMVFNIPESNANNPEYRKLYDTEKLTEFLSVIGLKDIKLTTVIRVGKPATNHTRPIKVILNSSKERREIFNGYRNRRDILSKHRLYNNVTLARDYTPKQCDDYKKLRSELTRRLETGENVMIRGGKIVYANLREARSARPTEEVQNPIQLPKRIIPTPSLSYPPTTSTPLATRSKNKHPIMQERKRLISYSGDLNNDSVNTDEETMIYSESYIMDEVYQK